MRFSISRRWAVLAIIFAIFSVLPASADWEQAFREGVRAYEKKNWSTAAQYMQAALNERSQASTQTVIISGGDNRAYAPSQYLAAALANLGDCDGAQAALRAAQGAAPGADSILRGAKKKCPSLDTSTGPTEREKQAERERSERDRIARETAAREQQLAQQQAAAKEQAQRDQAQRDQAAREQQAQQAAQAQRDEAARQAAAQTAAQQAAAQTAAQQTAAQQAAAAQEAARVEELKRSLNSRVISAQGTLASPGGDTRTRAALQDSVTNASRLLAAASSSLDLDAASTRLARSVDAFIKASSGIDPSAFRLKIAIQSYLRGDYKSTLETLDGGAFSSTVPTVLRAQALLFRAAATYGDALLRGEKNVGEKIAADLKEYRRLRGPAPDRRLFNPHFVSLVIAQ